MVDAGGCATSVISRAQRGETFACESVTFRIAIAAAMPLALAECTQKGLRCLSCHTMDFFLWSWTADLLVDP